MIRIAFIWAGADAGWMGGANYLRNLLHSVSLLEDRQIETILFVPPDSEQECKTRFAATEIIATPLVVSRSVSRLAGKLLERLFGRNVPLERLFKKSRIDILSHSNRPGRHSPVKTISWIADFQHHHMPDFFSEQELALREQSYRQSILDATLVLVSSEHSRRDLAEIVPEAAEKGRVLQFVSGMAEAGQVRSRKELAKDYSLPPKFFYLPNQFWVHKNHRVVIEALALLKKRGVSLPVVCTGHTKDFRSPGYFGALVDRADVLGVKDEFRIQGLVPYRDVAAFMKHSVAVINPSYFEGWSTTVEEAKSQGKAILLSDIEVHREQAPPRARFFPPDDAEMLARFMEQACADHSVSEEEEWAARAAEALPCRVVRFAQRYQEIVLEAVVTREAKRGEGKR